MRRILLFLTGILILGGFFFGLFLAFYSPSSPDGALEIPVAPEKLNAQ